MLRPAFVLAAFAAALIALLPSAILAQDEAPKPAGGTAAGEGGEKPPEYPVASASEEARIKELLALLAIPPALAAEKSKLDYELTGTSAAEEGAKAEAPEDPVEKQIEDLRKRIEEMESQIKAMSASLHAVYRKKLDQALKDAEPEEEIEKKKLELRTIEKFMRDLMDSEAAVVTGGDEKEMRQIEKDMKQIQEARKLAIEDRKRRQEAFYAKYSQFMKARREAMDELAKLGSKAVPLMSDALAAAGFDAGACIVEVLSSVKEDTRFHGPVMAWFGRQKKFDDALATPDLVNRVVAMKTPDLVPALVSGLGRASFQLKATFMAALYRAAKAAKENTEPALSALLEFLSRTDQANVEICINILNLFIGDPNVPKPLKLKVLQSYARIASAPDSGKLARNIAYGLGMSGMEEAVDPLVRMLRHKDQMVSIYAVQGLGNLGPLASKAARDVLELTTWSQSVRIQQSAIQSLGKIGSYEAVDSLIALLDSENKAIKMTSRDALRQILKVDFTFNTARWRSYWAMQQKKMAAGESGG